MIKVTEYYTPTCPMCKQLKQRLLATEGIECEFVDMTICNPIQATQAPWLIIEKDGKVIMNEHPTSIGKVIQFIQNNK